MKKICIFFVLLLNTSLLMAASFVVTNVADYGRDEIPIQGSLRYFIENAKNGAYITFNPSVFTKSGGVIFLKRPLVVGSDVHIDGIGANVIISSRVSWQDFELSSSGAECLRKAGVLSQDKNDFSKIYIRGKANNVSVVNLTFSSDFGHPPAWRTERVQDDCLKDSITVIEDADNVLIGHNRFLNCGDECVSVIQTDLDAPKNVVIENNIFSKVNKSILIKGSFNGLESSLKPTIKVKVLNNFFAETQQRNPRVQDAFVEILGNVVYKWKTSGMAFSGRNKLIINNNRFIKGGDSDALLFLNNAKEELQSYRGNVFVGDSLKRPAAESGYSNRVEKKLLPEDVLDIEAVRKMAGPR